MKIAQVVGKLSLSKAHPSLKACRWVIAQPRTLRALANGGTNTEEELIVVDELGANQDSLIGVSEGREASAPYEPKRVPVDAYTSCLLDEVRVDQDEIHALLSRL